MLNPLATNKKQLNERLREVLVQLRAFNSRRASAYEAEFGAWQQRTHRTLSELFGPSQYLRQFGGLHFCAPRVHIVRGGRDEPEWLPMDQARFDSDFVAAEQLLVDAIADSDDPQRQAADAAVSLGVFARLQPLLHGKVTAVAEERFQAGHYADAAEAALKAVNIRVKAAWVAAGNTERDGKNLMMAAFSVNSPTITLGDLATISGKDIQEGYMHLFAGAMQAIRNPKAHDFDSITPERAGQFLVLASLLMQTLDEAGTP